MQKLQLTRAKWWYDKRKSLGKGGFGEVFIGSSLDQTRDVAVKRIRQAGDWSLREEKISQFLEDGTRPHVLPVLDYGRHGGDFFVVMPRAETSLAAESVLRRFTSGECAEVLLEIVTGLNEVGELVHRDIQPANVLRESGSWKLADFGLARMIDAGADITVREHFTPAYAAPERWRFEEASASADLYSVGCIGYLLLQGQPPFEGDLTSLRQAHLGEVPPRLAGVDDVLALLLTELLKKVPNRRPSRSRTMSMLREIVSGQSKTETTGPATVQLGDGLERGIASVA